jgi:hypothetical protein
VDIVACVHGRVRVRRGTKWVILMPILVLWVTIGYDDIDFGYDDIVGYDDPFWYDIPFWDDIPFWVR